MIQNSKSTKDYTMEKKMCPSVVGFLLIRKNITCLFVYLSQEKKKHMYMYVYIFFFHIKQ